MANTNITIVDASSILIGARDLDTGVVGELRDIGLSTAFKAASTADTKHLKSAKGNLIQSIQLTPAATVSIDFRDISKDNLALRLAGEVIAVTEATGKTKSIASATGRNRLITSAVQGYLTGLGLEPGSTVTVLRLCSTHPWRITPRQWVAQEPAHHVRGNVRQLRNYGHHPRRRTRHAVHPQGREPFRRDRLLHHCVAASGLVIASRRQPCTRPPG